MLIFSNLTQMKYIMLKNPYGDRTLCSICPFDKISNLISSSYQMASLECA